MMAVKLPPWISLCLSMFYIFGGLASSSSLSTSLSSTTLSSTQSLLPLHRPYIIRFVVFLCSFLPDHLACALALPCHCSEHCKLPMPNDGKSMACSPRAIVGQTIRPGTGNAAICAKEGEVRSGMSREWLELSFCFFCSCLARLFACARCCVPCVAFVVLWHNHGAYACLKAFAGELP